MSEELSTIRVTLIVYHGDIWCIKMGRDVGWLWIDIRREPVTRCVLYHCRHPILISRDPDFMLPYPDLLRYRLLDSRSKMWTTDFKGTDIRKESRVASNFIDVDRRCTGFGFRLVSIKQSSIYFKKTRVNFSSGLNIFGLLTTMNLNTRRVKKKEALG